MEASIDTPASASRSRRSDSRASTRSRTTAQSSNSSSTNLHTRGYGDRRDGETAQERRQSERTPAGSLLQERLKEKKAARLSERKQSVDVDTPLERMIQSSPVRYGSAGGASVDGRRPSSSGKAGVEKTIGKKGMGVKEMEQAVSNLHKQNFDLKLELFHRRQRQSTLEEKLEAAESRLADQQEMQVINEQLLTELEKRDQAIDEAVGIISTLEEKIDALMQEREAVRSFDMQYESSYMRKSEAPTTDVGQEPSSSPPQFTQRATTSRRTETIPKAAGRMPSFLSEQSEGTEALRSLYLPNGHPHSRSMLSLPRLVDEDGYNDSTSLEGMNSPRLSVLSESSFISVYGEKRLALEGLDLDEGAKGSAKGHQHKKSKSVEKWLDDRHLPVTTPPKRAASKGRNPNFLSINSVLESPLQRLEKLERTLTQHNNDMATRDVGERGTADDITASRHTKGRSGNSRRVEVSSLDRRVFPPTPDTVSTSTLQRYNEPDETVERAPASRLAGHDQRPYFNRAQTAPLRDTSMIRPRSAGETVTSRRDGHGWDTDIPSQFTETNSDVDIEVASTLDPWIATGREKSRRTIQPPNMFTFGSDDEDWGQDMMFNGDSGRQVAAYRPLDQAGDEPLSDNTALPSMQNSRMNANEMPMTNSTSISPVPKLGQRRSSLSNLERGPDNSLRPSHGPTANAPSNASPKDTRRSRITSKIFGITGSLGRSDSYSSPGSHTSSQQPNPAQGHARGSYRKGSFSGTPSHPGRSWAFGATNGNAAISFEDPYGASATPPPISRYPRASTAGVGLRPTSAGGYAATGFRGPDKVRFRRENIGGTPDAQVRNGGARTREGPEGNGDRSDSFGVDGARDEREGQEEGQPSSISPKKWFGLGRNRSLRR
ncbi:MAG: hypothetical protein M1818_007067 [Claussenomyces sp. TS43310]|nr:MAG: hypothetical protein M1818_007067 [Claussenomyces sp. TS43310]